MEDRELADISFCGGQAVPPESTVWGLSGPSRFTSWICASCTSDEEDQDPDPSLGPMDPRSKGCDPPSVLDSGDSRTDLGEKGELAVCEELVKFLQATHYKRRTYYGIWKKKQIASRLAKSAAGKKSKAARNGRDRRSANRSRSPAGQ